MSDLLLFIVVVIVLAFIGTLVSLLALFPPIRKLAQRSAAARIAEIFLLGLMAFVSSFGLCTRLTAEAVYAFGTIVVVDTFDPSRTPTVTRPPDYQMNKPAVINELWIRLLIPPALRQPCYTNQASVCDLANGVVPATSDLWDWKGYLKEVGIGFVSVPTSSVLVWLFTRQRQLPARAA